MATIKAVIQLLMLLLETYRYIDGQVSTAIYYNKIRKIRDACRRAATGNIDDRLEGGQDVEDNFNNHTV